MYHNKAIVHISQCLPVQYMQLRTRKCRWSKVIIIKQTNSKFRLKIKCYRYYTNNISAPVNTQLNILTNNLLVKRLFYRIHLQPVDEFLRQRHDVFDVAKQRLHVLRRQRRRLRQSWGKERLKTQIETCAVVRLGWVEFRDDFLASFTLLLSQLLLADWRRLDWCCVTCFKQMKRTYRLYFTCFYGGQCNNQMTWPRDACIPPGWAELMIMYIQSANIGIQSTIVCYSSIIDTATLHEAHATQEKEKYHSINQSW